MTDHNVAVDEHGVAAFKLFGHARLQRDPLKIVSGLDVDVETIVAQVVRICLAALTVRILVERCLELPSKGWQRQRE